MVRKDGVLAFKVVAQAKRRGKARVLLAVYARQGRFEGIKRLSDAVQLHHGYQVAWLITRRLFPPSVHVQRAMVMECDKVSGFFVKIHMRQRPSACSTYGT